MISILAYSLWSKLEFYMINTLLIPWVVVAFIFLIYSIIDAVNDPILGYLTDKSTKLTKKWGKRYPFILIGILTFPILLIVQFLPIGKVNVGIEGSILNPGKLLLISIYLIVTMGLYETFLTLYEINHEALLPDMIRDSRIRTKLGGVSTFFFMFGQLLGSIMIPILIGVFGGEDQAISFILTAIVIDIIVYALIFLYKKGIRETPEMKDFRAKLDKQGKHTSPILKVLKRSMGDKNWVSIIIVFLTWSIGILSLLNGLNYLIVNGLGRGIEDTAIPLMAAVIVTIISIPLWLKLTNRFGTKKAFLIGNILTILSQLLLFFLAENYLTIIISFGFGGLGLGAYQMIIYTLRSEGIDHLILKAAKREEASYQGILRVVSAFSKFFQTLIFAIVAGITGFVAATTATNLAAFGLKIQMSLIPMVIGIIGAVIFFLFYDISKKKAIENKNKIIELGL
jgi:GPH family glycoside/pentoside/hexuronide:cation symporter